MKNLIKIADSAYVAIIHALAYVSIALLFLITLWTGSEVFVRVAGFGSMPGMVEFTEYAIFAMAFLAAPWVLYHNAHVRVQIVEDMLPPPGRALMWSVAHGVSAVVCGILTYYSFLNFQTSFLRGESIYGELVFPEWYVQWQMPAAFLLLCIGFIRHVTLGRPAATLPEDQG